MVVIHSVGKKSIMDLLLAVANVKNSRKTCSSPHRCNPIWSYWKYELDRFGFVFLKVVCNSPWHPFVYMVYRHALVHLASQNSIQRSGRMELFSCFQTGLPCSLSCWSSSDAHVLICGVFSGSPVLTSIVLLVYDSGIIYTTNCGALSILAFFSLQN